MKSNNHIAITELVSKYGFDPRDLGHRSSEDLRMIARLSEAGFGAHELSIVSRENLQADYAAAKDQGLFALSQREQHMQYIDRLRKEEERKELRVKRDSELALKVEKRIARADEAKARRLEQEAKDAVVRAQQEAKAKTEREIMKRQQDVEKRRLEIISKPLPAIANSPVVQIRDLEHEIYLLKFRIKNAAGVEFSRLCEYSNALRSELCILKSV